MSRQVLKFETNTPVQVALEYPDGLNVPGQYGPQVKFSLTENRVMFVSSDVAQAIKTLGVQPAEPFTITKRWLRGRRAWWDIEKVKKGGDAADSGLVHPGTDTGAARPSPRPGAIRVALPPNPSAQPPKTEPTPVSAPIPVVSSGEVKRIPPHSTLEAPPPSRGIQLTRTPPVKPSYEEAFRECLRIVTDGLAGAREQWSDGAKQAMVSTLMIQLGRENRLGEFRPQQIGKVA
jgi:hypothetical protein